MPGRGGDTRVCPARPQGLTLVSVTAHWAAHVLPRQEAPTDPHDEPGGAEPAQAAGAGLGVWPLSHQLPRGTPPLPQLMSMDGGS